jgi:hypothetical protein
MTVLTGADGDMFYGTERVGKVRNWSLSINRDAIDDTCLGDNDRTFISGLRNVTGSCSIFYDPGNKRARELMNTIFEDQAVAQDVSFVFNRKENDAFRCNVLLTNVTSSVDVGAAQAVNVTFQVSGAIEGRF